MTEQYTPEPWQVTNTTDFENEDPHQFGWIDRKGDEEGAGDIATTWATNGGDAHADARRIVACVNACAGISTAELEAGVFDEVAEALGNGRSFARLFHDDAAEACIEQIDRVLALLGRQP